MERPENFDSWSDECKQAFNALKAEWDARERARTESDAADAAARAAEDAKAAADEALAKAQAEIDAHEEWLDGYRDARRDKKRELEERRRQRARELEALMQDLQRRFTNGEITRDEARDEFQAAEARHDAAVEALEDEYDQLKDEKDDRRSRQRELRRQLPDLEREAETRRERANEARENAERALDEFEDARSETDIVKDYFALIVRCGPQDPEPGGASIPVPLDQPANDGSGEGENAEPTRWEKAVWDYIRELTPWFGYLFPEKPPTFVGVGSDTHPASTEPYTHQEQQEQRQDDEPVSIPIRHKPDGETWKEGCIEFMWVQGTRPEVDPRLNSNPITKTVARAMADVNTIWGRCACVRFTARIRVVTRDQLGDLWSRENGIFISEDRTRSVSKERIRANYSEIIRGLLDNENCTAFLVVDGVAGGAGFAKLSGRAGIVTINRVGNQQGYGDTTAHELGHTLAGIDHIVDEGEEEERAHEHGELMWGEGCADYPDRQSIRYDRLTEKDCESMKAAPLRDTGEPCGSENF